MTIAVSFCIFSFCFVLSFSIRDAEDQSTEVCESLKAVIAFMLIALFATLPGIFCAMKAKKLIGMICFGVAGRDQHRRVSPFFSSLTCYVKKVSLVWSPWVFSRTKSIRLNLNMAIPLASRSLPGCSTLSVLRECPKFPRNSWIKILVLHLSVALFMYGTGCPPVSV